MIPNKFDAILSQDFYKKVQSTIDDDFKEYLDELKSEDDFSSNLVSEKFVKFFTSVLAEDNIERSPLSFYWLSIVEQILMIVELHEEKDEEGIFDFWNETEFAEYLQKGMEDGRQIEDVSLELLALLEKQATSFYYINLKGIYEEDEPLTYFGVPEIGDSSSRVFVKGPRTFLENPSKSFPVIISEINFDEKIAIIQDKGKSLTINLKEHSSLDHDNFNLITLDNINTEEFNNITSRIENSLKIIQIADEKLLNLLKNYSHTFVNSRESGVVSYSSQFLPGYSVINFLDRSPLETIDDLIHENGHHFLNSLLNSTDLIIEDDEKIFFSPWRKSLRPIRGIYHAYCTFFWAFYLFSTILNKKDQLMSDGLLSENDVRALEIRLVEEFSMLEFSYEDILDASKQGKVEKDGLELVNLLQERMLRQEEQVRKIEERLTSSERLAELKSDLSNARKEYYS